MKISPTAATIVITGLSLIFASFAMIPHIDDAIAQQANATTSTNGSLINSTNVSGGNNNL